MSINSSINPTNVKILQELKAHTSDVTACEFWGNSLLFTGSSDKTVRVWKWTIGKGFVEESFSPLLGHKYGVTCVKVSPQGGVLASGSVDGSIILWDILTGARTHVLSQEAGEAVRNCTFSPNGAHIVSSDDSGAVCVWGRNKSLTRIIRCHEESVHTLAFSSDSNILLTGCTMGNVRLFLINDANENPDCSLDSAHDMGVLSADFCRLIHTDPNDKETQIYTVATCGTDHVIKIWRIYYLDTIKTRSSRSRLVPQSSQEHICGPSTIYCTEIMNAENVLTIPAHGSSITCVKFNSPGTLLISSSMDKYLKIFDLQGNCLKTLAEHHRYVNCIAITTDSKIIASGSNDRRVIIWDLTGTHTLDSHITDIRSLLFNLTSSHGNIPQELICPITHEIMRNPVTAEDGFTYESQAITEWLTTRRKTSPMTNVELKSAEVMENTALKHQIEEYLKALDFDKNFDAM